MQPVRGKGSRVPSVGPRRAAVSPGSGTPNLLPNRDLVKNSRTVCDTVCNKALAQSTYSFTLHNNSNY